MLELPLLRESPKVTIEDNKEEEEEEEEEIDNNEDCKHGPEAMSKYEVVSKEEEEEEEEEADNSNDESLKSSEDREDGE